jgi:uncharacterized Rossmann fold enzyme
MQDKIKELISAYQKEIDDINHDRYSTEEITTIMSYEILTERIMADLLTLVTQRPVCKLINGQFSWILEVDNRKVLFTGFDNADYFDNHYSKLGYQVIREDHYIIGG